MQTRKSSLWPLSLLAGGRVRGGWMRGLCRSTQGLLALGMPLLLVLAGAAWGQPVWEDVSPVPGHDVGTPSPRIISDESGLWTTFCSDSGVMCVLFGGGMRPYYSSDGGDTWELRDQGFGVETSVVSVAANPVNPDLLLASVNDPPDGYPYRSSDRGLNWYQVSEGVHPGRTGWSVRVGWFDDGVHAWCFTAEYDSPYQYHVSDNTGVTWEQQEGIFDYYSVATCSINPAIIVLGGRSVTRLRSTDFGRTWELLQNTDRLGAKAPRCWGETPNRVYGTGIYGRGPFPPEPISVPIVSIDTGRTWQLINPADTLRSSIVSEYARLIRDPFHLGHMLYTRKDSVFETYNDGQSWALLWEGPAEWHEFVNVAYDPSNDCIYLQNIRENVNFPGLWRLRRASAVGPSQGRVAVRRMIHVFPNPAAAGSNILIQFPPGHTAQFVVYDILGRAVYRSEADRSTTGGQALIPIPPDWAGGTYFVRASGPCGAVTRRFVVVR